MKYVWRRFWTCDTTNQYLPADRSIKRPQLQPTSQQFPPENSLQAYSRNIRLQNTAFSCFIKGHFCTASLSLCNTCSRGLNTINQILYYQKYISSLPIMSRLLVLALVVPKAMSFPFMSGLQDVRSPSDVASQYSKRQATCPFNANHVPAAPITSQFPYAGAINGLPSTRPGNFQVPANGDTAHAFVAPGPNDIRGPCPGLNTAANHNVQSRNQTMSERCADKNLVH